jgi:hypothetical protein
MNTPIGLFRVVELGAVGLDALGDHRAARGPGPMTRSRRTVGKVQDGLHLVRTIRPTGMPVQSETTEATACSSTWA